MQDPLCNRLLESVVLSIIVLKSIHRKIDITDDNLKQERKEAIVKSLFVVYQS